MTQNSPEDQKTSEERKEPIEANDLAAIIRSIFERPIAFYRPLVALTGSLPAALMLGQACYWDERTNDPEGWFWKTRDEWESETGLTRWEQEDARKKLRRAGFLQEKLAGVPARMYFRVDFEKIAAAYRKSDRQPVGGKTSNKNEVKPPTSRRRSLQHYKGTTEITSKTSTKTTAKTTAQSVQRARPVHVCHKNENNVKHLLSFEERKQLLLAQAEKIQQAEKKAGRGRDNDLIPIASVVGDLLTKAAVNEISDQYVQNQNEQT